MFGSELTSECLNSPLRALSQYCPVNASKILQEWVKLSCMYKYQIWQVWIVDMDVGHSYTCNGSIFWIYHEQNISVLYSQIWSLSNVVRIQVM